MASKTSSSPSASGTSSASDPVESAKASAHNLADTAESKASDKASQVKSKATGALGDVAEALHDTSDSLRDHDRDAFARFTESAASQIEDFTRSIRNRSVGEILDEAERFARREPSLFLGGAFLLGIAGSRFLKASSPGASGGGAERYRSQSLGASGAASRGYYGASAYGRVPSQSPVDTQHQIPSETTGAGSLAGTGTASGGTASGGTLTGSGASGTRASGTTARGGSDLTSGRTAR